jgi:dipeptide/tripeptide permease
MRKIISAVVAILTVLIAFLNKEFGLALGATAALGSLAAAVMYILGEARNDMARMKQVLNRQKNKWLDYAFWITLLTELSPILNELFKIKLSEGTINAIGLIVATILGVIFKRRQTAIVK